MTDEEQRSLRGVPSEEMLIEYWPTSHNTSPVISDHRDGTFWLETIRGDRWPERGPGSGPFPTRKEAVYAAVCAALILKADWENHVRSTPEEFPLDPRD